MFAEPVASRGKSRKAGRDGQPIAGGDKKALQKATKAQRRNGGIRRGGFYDADDLSDLQAPPTTQDQQEHAEPSDDEAGSAGGQPVPQDALEEVEVEGVEEGLEQEEAASAAQPTPTTSAGAGPAEGGTADGVRDLEEGLRRQLRAWAGDPGLPLAEQKRLVRQVLAQWHPDKNRHIEATATHIFQFIQKEVNRIIEETNVVANEAARREAEAQERRAQRLAEKSARSSAVQCAKEEKRRRKDPRKELDVEDPSRQKPTSTPVTREPLQQRQERADDASGNEDEMERREWSLVVGHGPATTPYLRPWPRSHLTLTPSPFSAASTEVLLFGGEAYDGRELNFYSDLYKLDLHGAAPSRPLPWQKVYSAVPSIRGPEARSSHQAVAWDKYLYIFGGEWSSRDQRRYRQFGDLWRIDASGGPGTRWESIDSPGCPSARSGHRMAASADGYAVLFGGFTEDKSRRATYLNDLYTLHLPSCTWQSAALPPGQARRSQPSTRAGGLLWMTGSSLYLFGGAHPRKKGGDDIVTLGDLWRAAVEPSASSSSSGPVVLWERLETDGEGPGCRSGMSQCAVSSSSPGRRLVFGGVTDLRLPVGKAGGQSKAAKEVAVFHQDIFLLDCDGPGRPTWSRVWFPVGAGPGPTLAQLSVAALPEEIRTTGGGADAQSLVVAIPECGGSAASKPRVPRGRIAAACAVVDGALWVFGGACESGPRREVTLDDLWRLELVHGADRSITCDTWECVLPLSDRATMWFDSDTDDEEDDDMEEGIAPGDTLQPLHDRGGGVLSKKQQKEEAKIARMEVKRQRQQEKCEEKTNKRELKKDMQRAQAMGIQRG